MAQTLGREISVALNENEIKGIKVTNGVDNVTHQQFVDDIMLFGTTSLAKARCFNHTLNTYFRASG